MNKLLIFTYLISTLFIGLVGCKNDFDLTSDWQEISIIYGLINPKDTTHYIKIEKAFLDDKTSALTIAKEGDSLYHSQPLEVKIRDANNGTEYVLNRVDGNLIGFPKEAGIFATSPNYIYTFTALLNDKHIYALTVRNTVTGQVDSASCRLVNGFQAQNPGVASPVALNFITNSVPPFPFDCRYVPAMEGRVYSLKAKIRYHETTRTDPSNIIGRDTIQWNIFDNIALDKLNEVYPPKSVKVAMSDFYQVVQNNVAFDINKNRYLDGIDFVWGYGGEELFNYQQVNNAQTGITSEQVLNRFTNIKGDKAFGIFSSRSYDYSHDNFYLNASSLDSLACGIYTKGLRFEGFTGPNKFCD